MNINNNSFEFRNPLLNWFDPAMQRQNIAGVLMVIFLLLGYLLISKFRFSEIVLLPFSFSVIAYGTMSHESQKIPNTFGLFTGQIAQNQALLYVVFGILLTVIIVFRVYFGIG